jgi:hypothetical protein
MESYKAINRRNLPSLLSLAEHFDLNTMKAYAISHLS